MQVSQKTSCTNTKNKVILHLDYVDVEYVLSIQGWLCDIYNQELDVPSIA